MSLLPTTNDDGWCYNDYLNSLMLLVPYCFHYDNVVYKFSKGIGSNDWYIGEYSLFYEI